MKTLQLLNELMGVKTKEKQSLITSFQETVNTKLNKIDEKIYQKFSPKVKEQKRIEDEKIKEQKRIEAERLKNLNKARAKRKLNDLTKKADIAEKMLNKELKKKDALIKRAKELQTLINKQVKTCGTLQDELEIIVEKQIQALYNYESL